MANKKTESQGDIIDEIRRSRTRIGREFRDNQKQFLEDAKKIAKKYGMKYGTPKKKKDNQDEAA
jgi:hypothetical protein